jgi:predicted nucleic acid-binding protein
MKEYILDANAVLIYVEDRNGATRVRQLFEQAEREQTRLGMSVINWGEVFYVLTKKSGGRPDTTGPECAAQGYRSVRS